MSADRSRNRRRPGRDRSPRHVAPVLDPNWRSPYSPSPHERDANRRALRTQSLRRLRPWFFGAVVVFALTVVLGVVGLFVSDLSGWWWPLVGVALVAAVLGLNELRVRTVERSIPTLAPEILGRFSPGGEDRDRERLAVIVDRLVATFGTPPVEAHIVADPAYNAALLPSATGACLIVTSALMGDFELIEIEGVLAHLMARERLGAVDRSVAAALVRWSEPSLVELAGPRVAFRADEVAAAAIRYPLGIARALERCAEHPAAEGSYFATDDYRATRWVWFDLESDRTRDIEGDLDHPSVRARALAEW